MGIHLKTSHFCIIVVFSLFLLSLPAKTSFAEDWVVTGSEVVENQTILLNGNLEVEDGGDLTLRGVTLTMNNSYDGEYGILVKSGGAITIEERTVITAASDSARFSFAVESAAGFLMRNSELSRCGWGSDTEELGDESTILSGVRGLSINANNAVIEGNTLSNNHVGIILTGSNITVDSNNIHSNKVHGIYVRGGTSCQITNNTVQHSSISSPLRMVDAEDNTVQGNTVSLSMIHRGTIETMWSHRNLFKNNTISGLGMGIVLMFVSNENQVIGNTISIDEAGIMVWGWNNLIQNNTISSAAESPATGIYMVYAYNTTVFDNDISGVIGDGIWLRHSSNNSILRNLVSASTGSSSVLTNGLLLQSLSSKNVIHGNQLNDFSRGISIFYESNENRVVSNQFARTSSLAAITDGSNSNLLYGNNFFEMGVPPYDSSTNRWDNEGSGNYWSKYTGTDGNNDGIGDESYAIVPKGVDNFPLMNPVSVGSLPVPDVEPATPPQMSTLFSKTVTGTEVIQDQTIVLAGISVESGGSLILRNVEIITGASDRCSDLGVAPGGSLKIYDSKIAHLANGYGFQCQPSKGSVFVMSGTELQVCGHEWPYGGLQIYTDNAVIENSILKHSQITFFNVSGGRIQGTTISQSREGISLEGCDSLNINDNTIQNIMGTAVPNNGCDNIGIEGNTIYHAWENGINIQGSDCTVRRNTINQILEGDTAISVGGIGHRVLSNTVSNSKTGIRIGESHEVIGNKISNCSVGLEIGWNNSISENNTISNCILGIDLSGESHTLFSNTIAGCETGLKVSMARDNMIYHNTFIDNTHQATDIGFNNSWDRGPKEGGNYWNNHQCTGNPSNGSQPYYIDDSGIDHYPFETPKGWVICDIDESGSADLADAILALKVLVGLNTSGLIRSDYPISGADVNGDDKIGMEEVLYILRHVSGLR